MRGRRRNGSGAANEAKGAGDCAATASVAGGRREGARPHAATVETAASLGRRIHGDASQTLIGNDGVPPCRGL